MASEENGVVTAEAQPQHNVEPENMQPSSRICIKNIPKYADEKQLREHFAAKGEVTDAKVMRTRDGKSRCFGFIGFASAEQAEEAVKYFHNSFMDSCKLLVEFAYKYGTDTKPQAWSKYTEGTSANKRLMLAATGANAVPIETDDKKKKKKSKQPKPEEEDPKLKEFLDLMAPRSQKPIWANDDTVPAGGVAPNNNTGATKAGVEKLVLEEDDDADEDELYEEMPTATDGSAKKKRKAAKEPEESDEEEEEDGDGKDEAVVDTGVSDMDYLKSRVRANFDDDDDAFAASDDESEDEEASDDEEDKPTEKSRKTADDDAFEAAIQKAEDEDVDAQPATTTSNGAGGGVDTMNPERKNSMHRAAEATIDPATVIQETGRLFVRNLPYTAAEEDLRTLFEPFGEVEEAHVVLDKISRRSKGFAMVQFTDPEQAVDALRSLDGSIFMGRLLHILPGKAPPPPPESAINKDNDDEDNGKAGSSFKRKRDAELKSSAGENKVAWNSLFMRSDTVAEAVAAHFGVTKAELLDPSASDMAVRLALGETQVIAQTKKALGEAGVDIMLLEQAAIASGSGSGKGNTTTNIKRSDRVLLVKNLPYSTDESELQGLFGNIGTVGRLVLPETHTLALVEYLEPADARKAFKSLAYKRYQHVPLYLEWAPANIFSSANSSAAVNKKKAATTSSKVQPTAVAAPVVEKDEEVVEKTPTSDKKKQKKQPAAAADANTKATAEVHTAAAGDDENIESSTIFVKNLSFKTVDASLTKHFEKTISNLGLGALRSAKVSKRKGPDGKPLSAGFGFVECENEATARAVIKALQGSPLDGHTLVLQLAQNKNAGAASNKKKKSSDSGVQQDSAKIAVRNVAFEATRRDILGLFTPFGHVKSCRLPRKFDGTPRGFAFVEFATPQEATNAVEAVQGTHLYGRRLVIEWAEEDGGLDEIRAKTAAKFRDEDEADPADRPSMKRSKK